MRLLLNIIAIFISLGCLAISPTKQYYRLEMTRSRANHYVARPSSNLIGEVTYALNHQSSASLMINSRLRMGLNSSQSSRYSDDEINLGLACRTALRPRLILGTYGYLDLLMHRDHYKIEKQLTIGLDIQDSLLGYANLNVYHLIESSHAVDKYLLSLMSSSIDTTSINISSQRVRHIIEGNWSKHFRLYHQDIKLMLSTQYLPTNKQSFAATQISWQAWRSSTHKVWLNAKARYNRYTKWHYQMSLSLTHQKNQEKLFTPIIRDDFIQNDDLNLPQDSPQDLQHFNQLFDIIILNNIDKQAESEYQKQEDHINEWLTQQGYDQKYTIPNIQKDYIAKSSITGTSNQSMFMNVLTEQHKIANLLASHSHKPFTLIIENDKNLNLINTQKLIKLANQQHIYHQPIIVSRANRQQFTHHNLELMPPTSPHSPFFYIVTAQSSSNLHHLIQTFPTENYRYLLTNTTFYEHQMPLQINPNWYWGPISSSKNNGKTAVFYAYTQNYTDAKHNLEFFINHGLGIPNTDTYIITGGNLDVNIPEQYANTTHTIDIENDPVGIDRSKWLAGLNESDNHGPYDHYIFINDSVIGPFFKQFHNHESEAYWTEAYLNKLNADTPLVGSTIDHHRKTKVFTHVQSYAFAMNRIGLDINRHLFEPPYAYNNGRHDRDPFITKHEVGLSTQLLTQGYMIASLVPTTENFYSSRSPYLDSRLSIDPFQVLFMKTRDPGRPYTYKHNLAQALSMYNL